MAWFLGKSARGGGPGAGFTADASGLAGGGGTLVRIEDSAGPYLAWLAKTFPSQFNNALAYVGAKFRKLGREAIEAGGPPGVRWPERRTATTQNRFGLLKRARWLNSGRWSRSSGLAADVFDREHARNARTSVRHFGKLYGALRYRVDRDKMRVQVGWLNHSAALFARAVQEGGKGTRGVFQFKGDQPVTKAMRRALWVAGVPLAKTTARLVQPRRPLVKPLFEANRGNIPRWIEGKVHEHVLRGERRFGR